jgi:hypothetical protein
VDRHSGVAVHRTGISGVPSSAGLAAKVSTAMQRRLSCLSALGRSMTQICSRPECAGAAGGSSPTRASR